MVSVVYLSGQAVVTYYFDSQEEASDWNAAVLNIKLQIAAIGDDGAAGPPRVPKYRRWLQIVDQFRNRFGNNKVPPDIQVAYDSVVANI